MRGDFSRWTFDERSNYAGVLHQQGRVLSDADWNAATRIADRWQNETARAVLGAQVAAVPESDPEALRVVGAAVAGGGEVTVRLGPGRAWAGGLLVYLRPAEEGSTGPEERVATYLAAPGDPGADGSRDAVLLELWRESVSGFQSPDELIEPALGGVDTTHRLWHGMALRLARLGPGETCEDILDAIADDRLSRRRLTVRLAPQQQTEGPCPVVVGGGYSGFEHNLCRVEIAQVDGPDPMFKWSRFNGGLVGRGTFDAATRKLTIRSNRQPILRSGLQTFYLEAYEPQPPRAIDGADDADRRARLAEEWQPVYGTRAVLASDSEIDLDANALFGTIPATPDRRVFFRLWDDVRPVADFSGPEPAELRDGIRLAFGDGDPALPGDHWTFPVRAGDVGNPQVLVDDRPPEGPERVRVPLAELRWGAVPELTLDDDAIEDCRKLFPPLTDLPPGCCVALAPGADLARAIRRLREVGGGCVCLLPGRHLLRAPLDLSRATDIRIEGFGPASRLIADPKLGDAPAIDVAGSAGVALSSFALVQSGPAPAISGAGTRDLLIERMLVIGRVAPQARPAIEIRDTGCAGWRIEDSVVVGLLCLSGLRLAASRIEGNRLLGFAAGISLSDMLDVTIAGNRIAAAPLGAEERLDALLADGDAEPGAIFGLLDAFEGDARRDLRSRFVAIGGSGMFDTAIEGNLLAGRVGLMGELTENVVISGNAFAAAAIGASVGLAHDVRVAGNRFGGSRADRGSDLSPRVGLRVLGDAVDLHVVDNRFLDVRDAISFESDPDGERDVLRLAEVDFRAFDTEDPARAREILATARTEVALHRAGARLVGSSFAALGRCERTRIEGNFIQADGIGIEWSGTKDVRDFRIGRNAFAGCRGGAILIEPDDRVHFARLAETVDTQVRLIDRNRFDVLGVAVRSTLGAVRVEKNDIRVRPTPTSFVPFGNLLGVLTAGVLRTPAFVAAADAGDVGNARLGSKEAVTEVRANPAAIDSGTVAERTASAILAGHPIDSGDVHADHGFLMNKLALADARGLIAAGSVSVVTPMLSDLEGLVVNLSGLQNEFTDNNLLSQSADFDGGVVLQMPSGTVTGNEVQAGRVALMVTAKIGQGRHDLRVEGNRLAVTGPARGDGKQAAAYALAIPTLMAGSYSILDNVMDGSVMVGAEPFAASGLVRPDILVLPNLGFFAHGLALDGKAFASANARAARPAAEAIATPISPNLIGALTAFVVDLFDTDPHRSRAVIQFADNRVLRGYVALARSTGGTFWTKADLQKQAATAPVVQVTGNVLDYWARVVARDAILTGNHSQTPIQYRASNRLEQVANIPAPVEF
jgi:hypothetical protein